MKKRLFKCCAVAFLFEIGLIVARFPRQVDSPLPPKLEETQKFYERLYDPNNSAEGPNYVDAAWESGESAGVNGALTEFVRRYHLEDKRVLEVGSGSGTLQDIVRDYSGLDIASNVRRFYHKPFVRGSATDLPFRDSEFDSIWSVWTLEHIPNPTRALQEMRRVVKPGGLLYLAPAWNCPTWAANGYGVRSYSDLNWREKLIKASIPVRRSQPYKALYMIPIRFLRFASWQIHRQPTDLRYILLQPGEKYWTDDSDALNSIDSYEAYLWFTSRGDACLNCDGVMLFRGGIKLSPLIIKVQKGSSQS